MRWAVGQSGELRQCTRGSCTYHWQHREWFGEDTETLPLSVHGLLSAFVEQLGLLVDGEAVVTVSGVVVLH